MTLTIATANWGKASPDAIHAIADDGADIICCQEMSDQRNRVTPPRGWAVYWPHLLPGQAACPIFYRRATVKVTRRQCRLVSRPRRVEDGAGGRRTKAKWWTALRFVHESQTCHVLNGHLIPTVEGHGSRVLTNKPRRVALWRRAAKVAAAMTRRRRRTGPVFVAGDFNAGPDYPLMGILYDAGLRSNWRHRTAPEGGSHGRRQIDHVLEQGEARFVDQRKVKTGSDHDVIVVEVGLP